MEKDPLQKILVILYFAFLFSLAMYWAITSIIRPEPADVAFLRSAFLAVAGTTAVIVLYIRRSRIAQILSSSTPVSPEDLARLRTYYILCYALSEAVALYGLVLHLLGGNRSEVAPFFGGAVVLFRFCYPRVPETNVASHGQAPWKR